jgi:hypothetical protein
MAATIDETLAYLETSYMTLPELASETGVAAERIETLIEAGCLPPHAHEAVMRLDVTTNIIGKIEVAEKRLQFYHPSMVALTRSADALARERGLDGAAAAIRARFDDDVAVAAGLAAGSPAHRDLADRAWAAWRDGTFGVCLKEIAAANMIRKVSATERMKTLIAKAADGFLDDDDVKKLDAALASYAGVTGPFGPHEIDGSTRRQVYEPALKLAQSRKERAAAE